MTRLCHVSWIVAGNFVLQEPEFQAVASQPCPHPQDMDPERLKRREEIQRAMSFIQ